MPTYGMLLRVVLIRTDVSEECIASIIRVTIINELGTMFTVTKNRSTLQINIICNVLQLLVTANVVPSSLILFTVMMEAISSCETLVPARATLRNIPEDGILHSHRSENLKSYE
jgi:phage-related holin